MSASRICFLLIFLIEGIVSWIYFSSLFERKQNNLWPLLWYFLGYSFLFIISDYQSILLNTGCFILVNTAISLKSYYASTKDMMIYNAFLCFIMCFSEIFAALILNLSFHNFSGYQNNLDILILCAISEKLLYFFFVIIFCRIVGKKEDKTTPLAVLFLLAFPISSVFVIISMTQFGLDTEPGSLAITLMVIGSLLLLISNIFLWIIYEYIQKIYKENNNLLLLNQRDAAINDYYRILKDQYDAQAVLIHDIKNHLCAIDGLAKERECLEVCDYIEKTRNLPSLKQRRKFCSDEILNIVFSRFSDLCLEKGITFDCDIRNYSSCCLDSTEKTALFGNLLSNAIESAECSKEKIIEISVSPTENGKLFIRVINSCNEKPQFSSNGELLSSKSAGNHGYGMKSIQRILKKYSALSTFYYDETEQRFHSVIQL